MKNNKAKTFIKSFKKDVVKSIRSNVDILLNTKDSIKFRIPVIFDHCSNLLLDDKFSGQVDTAIFELYLEDEKCSKKDQHDDNHYVRNRRVVTRGFTLSGVDSFSYDRDNKESTSSIEYIHEYNLCFDDYTERITLLADALETAIRHSDILYVNITTLTDKLKSYKIAMINSIYNLVKDSGELVLKNTVISDSCNSNIDSNYTDDEEYLDILYSLHYDKNKKAVFTSMSLNGYDVDDVDDYFFATEKDIKKLNKDTFTDDGDSYPFTEELCKVFDEIGKLKLNALTV